MKVFFGIIFTVIIVAIALIIGVPLLLVKGLEDHRRKKFGDNYELAANSETAPVECEPDTQAIDPEVIKERTGIEFPPFEVERCVSLLRHFTGDYVEEATIRFEEIPMELYAQIRASGNWDTELRDNEVCYICRHRDMNGFWSMCVYAESPKATINYGK